MNENIDLTKILKNCPKGTKLYTPIWGEVVFIKVEKYGNYPICINTNAASSYTYLSKDGRYLTSREESECILFPSKDQRDWSKFTAPWYKKWRFDPKTLQPFAKVLVRENNDTKWECSLFSRIINHESFPFKCVSSGAFRYCIPYNKDTKHLVGTYKEAPEYYRYWKD